MGGIYFLTNTPTYIIMYYMNRKYLLVGVVVLLIVLGLLWNFTGQPDSDVVDSSLGGNDPTAEMISSADGKLILEIPSGAMPEGMSIEEIGITNITAREFFGLSENQTPSAEVVAYRLEPSGTSFNAPALVHIETEAPDLAPGSFVIPNMLHSFNDEDGNYTLDVPLNTSVAFNTNTGTAKVSGEILHFSNIAVDRSHGLFRGVYTPAGGEFFLHNTFDFTLVVTDTTTSYMTGTGISGRDEPVEVTVSVAVGTVSHFNRGRDSLTIRSSGHLSPQEVDRPYETVLAGREYIYEQAYTCASEGDDSLIMVGGTHIGFTRQINVPARGSRDAYFRREEASTNFGFGAGSAPRYKCVEEVEFEYLGGQTIEVGPSGEFIDRGYEQQGSQPVNP